jgi:multidrug transporter EmrE-like cation transporter
MNAILLLFAILLAVSGQFLLKTGVLITPPAPQLASLIATFTSWRVVLGLALYAFSTVFWLFILKRLPLSIAYPTLSVSYIAILFISVVFLGESFSATKLAGVVAIMLGVGMLYL